MQFFPISVLSGESQTNVSAQSSDGKSSGISGLFANLLASQDNLADASNADKSACLATVRSSSAMKNAARTTSLIKTDESSDDSNIKRLMKSLASDSESSKLGFLEQVKQLTVSQEDFDTMKEALLNMGFSEEDLDEIKALMGEDGGLTWNAFIEQLTGMIAQFEAFAPVELDVEQARHLQNLFQEMGFTPQESDDLLEELSQGRLDKVWTALNQRLNTLPKESLNISREQIEALSQALKLPEDSKKRILQLFSSLEEGGFAKNEFEALVNTIKQESASLQQELESNLTELRSSLGETLNQALSSIADEKAQQEHIKWIKTKADESTDKSALDKTLERSSEESEAGDAQSDHNAAKGKNSGSGDFLFNSKDESDQSTKGKGQEDAAWRQLLEKVSVQGDTLVKSTSVENTATTMTNENQATTARANISSQEVFQQVQNGILRNLSNGTKQLTLQLDPPELGHVQLTISVTEKEVSAIIRPESHEASKLIAEQMSQLKQILEDQGLKVQRLEVQTQMQGDRGTNNWNGTGDHNLAQEQRSQMEKSSFFRKLSGKSDEVVQEMQNEPISETLSQGGLYLIA